MSGSIPRAGNKESYVMYRGKNERGQYVTHKGGENKEIQKEELRKKEMCDDVISYNTSSGLSEGTSLINCDKRQSAIETQKKGDKGWREKRNFLSLRPNKNEH
jgi:hypothetical protein